MEHKEMVDSPLSYFVWLDNAMNGLIGKKDEVTSSFYEQLVTAYLEHYAIEIRAILGFVDIESLKDAELLDKLSPMVSCMKALEMSECVVLFLRKNLSLENQTSLVWEILCSVPMAQMSLLMGWLADSNEDFDECLNKIIPQAKILQKIVFTSRLGRKNDVEEVDIRADSYAPSVDDGSERTNCLANAISHWQTATERKLSEFIHEVGTFSREASVLHDPSLDFIAAVLRFHVNAEHEMISELGGLEEPSKQESPLHGLLTVIEKIKSGGISAGLKKKIRSHAKSTTDHFCHVKNEVLEKAQKVLTLKRQQELLYQSLCRMPLRLMELVLPWLVRLKTEDEAKVFLSNMLLAAPSACFKLFTGWACKGRNSGQCLLGEAVCTAAKKTSKDKSNSCVPNLGLTREFRCNHHNINCKILAGCCGKWFSCSECHDEAVKHPLEETLAMLCLGCYRPQEVAQTCMTYGCGLSMAAYYCTICDTFSDERDAYHCQHCGICRVGPESNNFHCMTCNVCYPVEQKDVHICIPDVLNNDCCICLESMHQSTIAIKKLSCGHCLHLDCFEAYIVECDLFVICPICKKSVSDMRDVFASIDTLVADTVDPDLVDKVIKIHCNDCGVDSTIPMLHHLFHKCGSCNSYNTAPS